MKDGTLYIKSQTPMEAYSLRQWTTGRKTDSDIVFDYDISNIINTVQEELETYGTKRESA